MKNKITKQTRKDIKDFYKKVEQSKVYKFLVKLPLFIRLFLSLILFTYWVVSWIIPILPFATASLVVAGLILHPDTKFFQSKTLYYLNRSWIKKQIILWYISYKIFKRKK